LYTHRFPRRVGSAGSKTKQIPSVMLFSGDLLKEDSIPVRSKNIADRPVPAPCLMVLFQVLLLLSTNCRSNKPHTKCPPIKFFRNIKIKTGWYSGVDVKVKKYSCDVNPTPLPHSFHPSSQGSKNAQWKTRGPSFPCRRVVNSIPRQFPRQRMTIVLRINMYPVNVQWPRLAPCCGSSKAIMVQDLEALSMLRVRARRCIDQCKSHHHSVHLLWRSDRHWHAQRLQTVVVRLRAGHVIGVGGAHAAVRGGRRADAVGDGIQ